MKTIITTLTTIILTLTAMGQKVYPITGTVSMLQPTCHGYSNGELTVTPNGGQAPFTYLWSNGETTPTISDLSVGNYSVLVTDAVGQQLGGVFTLPEPEAITIQGLVTNTQMGQSNGSIDVTSVNGAVGDYTWNWSTNNGMDLNQSLLDQTNLKKGGYKITITDENGCQGVTVFTVNSTFVPFNNPNIFLPNTSNNQSLLKTSTEITVKESKVYLDMMGRKVNLEESPSGYYFVLENGIVIEKIYKN